MGTLLAVDAGRSQRDAGAGMLGPWGRPPLLSLHDAGTPLEGDIPPSFA